MPTLNWYEGKKETEQKSEVKTEGENSSEIRKENRSKKEDDDELKKERKTTVNTVAIERCQHSEIDLTWEIGIGDGDKRRVLLRRWGFPTGNDGVSTCNERRNNDMEEMNDLTLTVVYQ